MSRGKSQHTEAARAAKAGDAESQTLARRVWEQVSTLLFAILIALGIRAFVIEPFRIPSESMLPTLLIGDHLFVNKFVYGPKIPFTDYRLPGLREPQRGDVVVFKVAREGQAGGPSRIIPADERPELSTDDFVKRIVGLPGDRVQVRQGRVYINDRRVELEATGGTFENKDSRQLVIQVERLQGCQHQVLDTPGVTGLERAPMVVPEGRYFMLGDNRDNSNDSRQWGTVRFEEIKGPAFILYWSWDVNGNFWNFLNPINWFRAEKRWSRMFQRVRCDPEPETQTAG